MAIETMNDSRTGWLLVGHGTRNLTGQAEFLRVVQSVTERASCPVEASFLELAEPSIAAGLEQLKHRGVERVVVVPLLLFAAGHAKQDVPEAVFATAAALGLTVVGQAAPLEFHPELLALSKQRVLSAVTDAGEPSRLLLVGRGNSDPAAIATVHEYAQRLGRMCQLEAETAFVAAAEPKLPKKLRELAERQWPCVVIVPHLLFTGEVLHTIGEHVAAIAREFPATRWCLAEHLGPDARLTTAILDRAAAVDQHA